MSEGSSSADPEGAGTPGTEVDPLVGTVIADRYRVDAQLGVGGMGAVYRAEHVLMRKPVAVKVLHREMTVMDEVVKRFEREAIAAGRIDHPNVTVATDFGKLEDGSFYLVLEYVPGRSLTQAMAEGPMPVERALFIARQVAAGLAAAHAAGIVHRDLKPDNIMLIERGGTKDFVKVLDFGIAKISAEASGGAQLTRIGSVFGTPAYMAPEQAAGQPVDHRADLYSLGLVLYEMLAGHAAFEAEELVALLTKQLTEPPPPLPDTVDPEVAALVMQLLEKDPNARPQSAAELVSIIDARLGPQALQPDSSVAGAASARVAPVATAVTADDVPASLRRPPVAAAAKAAPAPRAGPGAVAELARRVLGGDSLRIAGRDVPLWLLGAAVGAVFMGGALTLGVLRASGGGGGAASHAPQPAPELGAVIAKAEEGDRPAIDALLARPEKGRTAGEWMAIGKGHSRLAEDQLAVEAFQHAVTLDPELVHDKAMLHAVRRAADDDAAQKLAFELAAGPLGAEGADLLFDVWASTSEKTQTTALAKALLDKDDVRSHASDSLRVALELRRATRCEDVKRLLPSAKENGDERVLRRLTQLASRKGCGFLGLSDCFPCLRQDDELSDAQKAVQLRKAPRF
jgi:eukaryotic-like serine/threonine-protein kinase